MRIMRHISSNFDILQCDEDARVVLHALEHFSHGNIPGVHIIDFSRTVVYSRIELYHPFLLFVTFSRLSIVTSVV